MRCIYGRTLPAGKFNMVLDAAAYSLEMMPQAPGHLRFLVTPGDDREGSGWRGRDEGPGLPETEN